MHASPEEAAQRPDRDGKQNDENSACPHHTLARRNESKASPEITRPVDVCRLAEDATNGKSCILRAKLLKLAI
jgi:hypothetical protein